ncbi:MAG: glycosyl hydrolase family 28-related protein [Ignavibacteriales bacterium]|nr:glycosyl hydrolase family 28-related protein [Ignavibacteriales bacterium]
MKKKILLINLFLLLNILHSQVECTLPNSGTINDIFNVKNFGAKGDGHNNDTRYIQQALDSIKERVINCGRGGTVYFPQGIYMIDRPLKIPPRCTVLGLSGIFTQSYDWDKDYFKHQPVVIRLLNDANCNMIEPYQMEATSGNYQDYENVIVQGITLDGNQEEQKNTNKTYGFYVPERKPPVNRPNFILRDVMIFNVKGDGFHSGKNQGEYTFEKVCAKRNSGYGFYFNTSEDVAFDKVWACENGEDGFHFESCGAMRFMNCDAWGNKESGIYLYNSGACYFDILQSAYNYKQGVVIKECFDVNFTNAIFYGNDRLDWDKTKPTISAYPEVLLISNQNGFGSYGVKFIACKFGQSGTGVQSSYAIFDSSINHQKSIPRNNSLIGCMFVTNRFNYGICNDNVMDYYIFEGCTGGLDGALQIPNPASFRSYNSASQTSSILTPQNYIIEINTEKTNYNLQLPLFELTYLGKEFIVIKSHSNNSILIKPSENQLINGSSATYTFSGSEYSQIKIINGGNNWIITH